MPAKEVRRPRAHSASKPSLSTRREKNYCFGCGRDNPTGMHLKMGLDAETGVARGSFRTVGRFRGSRLHLHGGIIATLLDEAMGKLNRLDAIIAPTADL